VIQRLTVVARQCVAAAELVVGMGLDGVVVKVVSGGQPGLPNGDAVAEASPPTVVGEQGPGQLPHDQVPTARCGHMLGGQ
jgi:hypothetical protein